MHFMLLFFFLFFCFVFFCFCFVFAILTSFIGTVDKKNVKTFQVLSVVPTKNIKIPKNTKVNKFSVVS